MKAHDARVLLTGATGGIGETVALALAESGAAVLLAGRSAARVSSQARSLQRRFSADASRIDWHAADLTDALAMQTLAAAAAKWRCNVIVHNAGMSSFGRLESVDPGDMLRVLQTNLIAPMLLTQSMLPHLRAMSAAQVICVGSALGRLGLPGYSVYSASKFGLRGFAEALRRELADTHVRVQYLGPRSTRTAFNSEQVLAYNRATGTAMDAPERVARALLRLLEDESAERFIGFPERLAVRLNGMAPALLDGSFARHRRNLPDGPAATPCEAPARALSPHTLRRGTES